MMWRYQILRTGRYKGIPVPPDVLECIQSATLAHWERQSRGEAGRGYAAWQTPTFTAADGATWCVHYDGTVTLVPADSDF